MYRLGIKLSRVDGDSSPPVQVYPDQTSVSYSRKSRRWYHSLLQDFSTLIILSRCTWNIRPNTPRPIGLVYLRSVLNNELSERGPRGEQPLIPPCLQCLPAARHTNATALPRGGCPGTLGIQAFIEALVLFRKMRGSFDSDRIPLPRSMGKDAPVACLIFTIHNTSCVAIARPGIIRIDRAVYTRAAAGRVLGDLWEIGAGWARVVVRSQINFLPAKHSAHLH